MLFFQGIRHKSLYTTSHLMDQPYIICANHASHLDILSVFASLGKHRFLFIGKKELLNWPILKIFFKNIDIAIDRNNPREALKSLERAKNELKNNWSICIFPEGGIHEETPKIHQFKNGAFKMAIEAQTPILPITFIDNWYLFSSDPIFTANAQPGTARYIIHDPIPTKGMTQKDLVSLREQTHKIISAPIKKYHNNALKSKKNGNNK